MYSNRVSFHPATDSTLTVSMVQNYYPFGRNMGDTTMNYSIAPNNRYQYESKEWNDNLGMDMYDFGARYYDPTRATWHSIDPLAEGSAEWSGYNYVEDNPVNIMDMDGMQPCASCDAHNFHIGGSYGLDWNIASGGASAAGAVVNTINAVNAFTPGFSPGFSKVQDFSKFGASQTATRSSIPQAGAPVQLDKSGITPDQREFIDKVTYRILNEYARAHAKPIHVGQYNPNTGRIQGSGAVEQLLTENVIIQVGLFLASDGWSGSGNIGGSSIY